MQSWNFFVGILECEVYLFKLDKAIAIACHCKCADEGKRKSYKNAAVKTR